MNHSLPGVNAGYITRERLLNDHVRKQQERISMIVLSSIERAATEVREQLRAWLCKSNLTFDE
jgi:sensor c-di-GMP phosphodiesterase-like protein